MKYIRRQGRELISRMFLRVNKGGVEMSRFKKAQSTLEYVIVFTAIIAGIIIFANTVMKNRVQGSLEDVAGKMENKVKSIDFGN